MKLKQYKLKGFRCFFAFPFVIAYNVMCFVVSVKSYATVSILLPVKTVPGTEFTHNSTQYNSLTYKSEQISWYTNHDHWLSLMNVNTCILIRYHKLYNI